MFKCNACKIEFSSSTHLHRHKSSVHGTKKFSCIICGLLFSRHDSVVRHVRTVHLVEKFSNSNFYNTVNTHFECIECGMKYRQEEELKAHTFQCQINEKFECYDCSAKFRNKRCLIRHLRTDHLSYMPAFKCNECNSVFSRPNNLQRHKSSVHGTKKFNCDKCGNLFSRQDDLTRHIKYVHLVKELSESNFFSSDITYFECAECGMKCRRKDVLRTHIFHCHSGEKFECYNCSIRFRNKRGIIRHMKTKHSSDTVTYPTTIQSRNLTVKNCALCRRSFPTRIAVLHHYKVDHHVDLEEQELKFNTPEEFSTWKKSIEDSTNSRFVVNSVHKQKWCVLTIFYCHRSGLSKIKSSDRKRRLKLKGSKKLGAICPAEMRLRQSKIDSTCVVSFFETHLGHDQTNRKEVAHMFLRKDDRLQLATKIASGMPLKRILDECQKDDLLLYDLNVNFNRKDLVSNMDLHSIKTTFNLKLKDSEPSPFSDDVSCIETFVTRYVDFILYYKKQHELPDVKFPLLKSEDLVLIFMSTSQKELLMKHGSNVIAMDRTQGMVNYDFFLQTLLILDYDGEGFPVAFAISNRNDITIVDVFLTCIREKVGILHPRTLLTDMQESFYNSWKKIMSIPKFRIFCPWIVRKAWRNNLKKINNQHKRELVKKMLYDLSTEADEQIFMNKLEELFNVGDVDEFLKYLQDEYITCVECWAYCYWQVAGINTNMHLEGFHRSIKYIHSRGKKVKDLYSGLIIIRNILRRKLKLFRNKMSCGAVTRKLRILRKEHNIAAAENDMQVEKIKEGEWIIEYFHALDTEGFIQEMNYVRQVMENCPVENDPDYDKCNLFCIECGACAHLYRCTCTENAVKNNMCKHIHSVLLISNKNISIIKTQNKSASPEVPLVENVSTSLEIKNIKSNLEVTDASLTAVVEGGNIIKYKEELLNEFTNVLNLVTSTEEAKILEKHLKLIPAH